MLKVRWHTDRAVISAREIVEFSWTTFWPVLVASSTQVQQLAFIVLGSTTWKILGLHYTNIWKWATVEDSIRRHNDHGDLRLYANQTAGKYESK